MSPHHRRLQVYPRVCGGTPDDDEIQANVDGLSPRMRGNRRRRLRFPPIAGSIPAYAGEPCRRCGYAFIREVYPRVCGGTTISCVRDAFSSGLSPRMRGNQWHCHLTLRHSQSIPAYAGEPHVNGKPGCQRPVYPRVCGGTPPNLRQAAEVARLSPRMRGNPTSEVINAVADGSIPAYAGEPLAGTTSTRRCSVYPRVCGGTWHTSAGRNAINRLSPRMRRNHNLADVRIAAVPSIPAYAEEPSGHPGHLCPGCVYPRVCGGTHAPRQGGKNNARLSPRMRRNPCGAV